MNDYSLGVGIKIRTNKKRRSYRPLVFWVLLISLISGSVWLRYRKPSTTTSVLSTQDITLQASPTQAQNKKQSAQEYLASLKKETETLGGTVSVYIVDIQTQKEWGIHESTMLTAASVNKIPILAALYHEAGSGNIDLEKIITLQAEDIQDFGTGSIRYDPPGTVYSIKTLARLMMEKSDNTAAYILANQILGIDKVQAYVDSFGMTQTNIANNTTSAKDMSRVLIHMYKGDVTSPSLTQEMMGFMLHTDFEDRISAGVGEGINVYHKTGDEINKVHDVGIIDIPGHSYYLGVLTTDQTNEERAKEVIRNISRITYTYLSQQ